MIGDPAAAMFYRSSIESLEILGWNPKIPLNFEIR